MNAKRLRLFVAYSPVALQELDAIWDWNETTYGREHAARYVEFLERHIDALAENYVRGRTVESRPEFRYLLMRRKSKGHGHVAVYRISGQQINVLHVFHTAQDWQQDLQ